jgi:hypothetical protein
MEIQQYFYFIGTTIFLPIWIYLFLKKDKRNDMLFIGICFGICAVIFEYYAIIDYWSPVFIIPNVPLESFYYGFIFGGISAEISELILKKRNSKRRVYATHKALVLLFAIIIFVPFIIVKYIFKLNSIIGFIIPLYIVGFINIYHHRELWKSSVVNAIATTVLTVIMFQILLALNPNLFTEYWHLNNLSGIFWLRLPIEELLFAASIGFGSANAFEVIWGYKLVKE